MIALLNVLAYLPRRPLAPSPQVTYRPVVVLLHGTNSSPRVFRRLSLALARRGIAFVAPSYGKHGSAPVTECVDELVETVAGYKEIDIVGHSFGGLVGLEVARRPELSGRVRRIVGLGAQWFGQPNRIYIGGASHRDLACQHFPRTVPDNVTVYSLTSRTDRTVPYTLCRLGRLTALPRCPHFLPPTCTDYVLRALELRI